MPACRPVTHRPRSPDGPPPPRRRGRARAPGPRPPPQGEREFIESGENHERSGGVLSFPRRTVGTSVAGACTALPTCYKAWRAFDLSLALRLRGRAGVGG